ncbi:unnamed protein product, partial [Rotaria magnacalcarata]
EGVNIQNVREELPGTGNQPIAVAVGCIRKPIQCFVVIEKEVISCQSLLVAVDIAFKSFYLFNLEYPSFARNVYLFIQHFFYGIKPKALPTCVSDLCDTLGK